VYQATKVMDLYDNAFWGRTMTCSQFEDIMRMLRKKLSRKGKKSRKEKESEKAGEPERVLDHEGHKHSKKGIRALLHFSQTQAHLDA